MKVFLLLLTLCFFSKALSQVDDSKPENKFSDVLHFAVEKYGVNQQLVNGKYFEYKYAHALGHPFLLENRYFTGNVIIWDTEYKDLQLKYDIYEQSLIIKSTIENYDIATLLPIELVTEFSYEELYFRRYSFGEKGPSYYQLVVEEDDIACLYYWDKIRDESFHNITFSSYVFRKSRLKKYLLINGNIWQYKNRRSFIKIFPEEVRRELLSYLKSEKLRVKKATDHDMKSLIQFCSNQLKQDRSGIMY